MEIKFNMACGKRLYPSSDTEVWVNIDIVHPVDTLGETYDLPVHTLDTLSVSSIKEAPKGHLLFHHSDVTSLNWVDGELADEIHAYHIIEHLYRTEVVNVLKEWKRVLKTGGYLCMEQPDVMKCAANMLLGYVRKEEQLVNQLGILGFFGDGSKDQPFMGHKWGWFPESLTQVMQKAGFIDIINPSAKTHMKDVRDFRLEGKKPADDNKTK